MAAPKAPKTMAPAPKHEFALGSRPAVLRSPALDRPKPLKPNTRDYGKTTPLIPPSMTGFSQ